MKTAVISCGPSWKKFIDDDKHIVYDLVIGINWIARYVKCHWVCAHDAGGLVNKTGIDDGKCLWSPREPLDSGKYGRSYQRFLGTPHWFLHWYVLEKLDSLYQRQDVIADLEHMHVLLWPKSDPDIPYSGLASLRLLHILAIDHADLYGFDMANTIDGMSTENGSRSIERWTREREIFWQQVERYKLSVRIIGKD